MPFFFSHCNVWVPTDEPIPQPIWQRRWPTATTTAPPYRLTALRRAVMTFFATFLHLYVEYRLPFAYKEPILSPTGLRKAKPLRLSSGSPTQCTYCVLWCSVCVEMMRKFREPACDTADNIQQPAGAIGILNFPMRNFNRFEY